MLIGGPLDGGHVEAVLAAGYALFLLAIAFGIERLARRTHGRALSYETAGFVYHPDLDAWECPAGVQLLQIGIEYERRLAHYQAPASTCNRCPLKSGCTDSDAGRELTRTLDPWLETEIGRFHSGLSLVLVALATLITAIGLLRNHADGDVLVLTPAILAIVLAAARWLRRTRRSPGVPQPAPVPTSDQPR